MTAKAEPEKCATRNCPRDARMAIHTARSTRTNLKVTIYPDNRVAPKSASRYCKACGRSLARDLVTTLVDSDG